MSGKYHKSSWVVWYDLEEKLCSPEDGTNRYQPSIGNAPFDPRIIYHESEKSTDRSVVIVPADKNMP